MAPDMPRQIQTPSLNTLKESSEPVATSTMKMGPSQSPGGVAHPAPPDGAPALGQERPVTMTEAVSYLHQVKAHFVDQPDIYNTFIYFLKDFESQVIDFPGIVSRVSELFAGHPNVIQGFNIYLPDPYRIECDYSNDPNTICATGHPVTRNELTPFTHINPPKMPAAPPNTPTKSSEPVTPSTIYEIGALTSMLSEQRTKISPSQPPGGVAHPAYFAPGALALSQKQQEEAHSYLDQVRAQFIDQPDIYNTFLHTMKDYTDLVIDIPGVINRMSELFAGHPSLVRGFSTFLSEGYQIECGASNDPVANNAITPIQTEQWTAMNDVAPQQPGAESFALSMMMGPWSTSLPLPQMLAILIQPPELTRKETELFPPIMVRLLQPEDMQNVYAIATLLCNGIDVTYQLRGDLFQSPIDGTFRFPGLTIDKDGVYCLRIILYHMDLDSGVTQVGCVDSNAIIIGPRPDGTAICRSIGDVTVAQDALWVKQPLLYQTVDANTCIYDHTGYFPSLKVHASSSVITIEQIEQIEYSKYMVFKPVSDFILEAANLERGLYNFGYGLFLDEGGIWFDDGEIERAGGLDESVLLGDDGELYRKRTDGVFNGLYVGLERRVTTVGNGDNNVMCIAHNVLIN
ncbi:hypothetical protein V494_02228 [Pseudogymnoascus sp. VKM F-4513 (FW-928)]|nr:hypothetical protein V494_02228 [Pseudogymnoascus sp. VKM F-4513 (FW-928)]